MVKKKEWIPIEGFNRDVDNETYHANKTHVSSSVLKTIGKSLEDYKDQYIDGNSKPFFNMDALNLGSYIHALILEPHVIKDEFLIYNSAEDGKWVDFIEKYGDDKRIIITESQHKQAKELLASFYKKTVITKEGCQKPLHTYYIDGQAEETLCVDMNGVKVKVRFDYRNEKEAFIADIKTTSSKIRSKKDVEKVCRTWGYPLSAALYCDAVELHTGIKHDFYFTFISKADGKSTMWKASPQFLELGRKQYKAAIEKLKEARETGLYFEGITEIDAI